MTTSKRYFITGATGFIGGHVVDQLLAAGHEVVALVRDPARADRLAAKGVTLVRGDITDKESMREAMRGADGLYHIAAWYVTGARDTSIARTINILGTQNVLELMRELEIPKGVYTSTTAVFSNTQGKIVDEDYRFEGKHLTEYDRTKWVAHYQIALPMIDNGLPLVIVHPGVVYGPGDHSSFADIYRWYLRRILPVVPLGFKFCMSHVEDCARGHLLAMEKGEPGENYIIAGPIYSLVEVLEICKQITGIPLPLLRLPPWMMKLNVVLMTPVSWLIDLPVIFHPEGMRTSAGVTYIASSARAEREFGWSTRPLEEGLREMLASEMRGLGKEPDF